MRALRKEDTPLAERILAQLELGNLVLIANDAQDVLDEVMRDGSTVALAQVGFDASSAIVNQLNELALQYARARGAELVGMKWVDGELVENPNAEWAITDSTRDMIRADVANAIESGVSNDTLADTLQGNYAFSDARAEMIARTETAFADVQGNLEAYKASDVVEGKEWMTAPDCCDDCADLDGVIVSLEEDFPGDGGDGPPLHPNCRCDVLPVLKLEGDDE